MYYNNLRRACGGKMYKNNKYFKICIVLVFSLIFIYLIVKLDIFNKEHLLKLISERKASTYFQVYFMLIAAILLVFFVPISWISLSAAILFGIRGSALITIAGMISSVLSFGISRIFKEDVSNLVEKIYNKKERKITLDDIYSKVKEYGFSYVFFIRSMPFIPFSIGNYIFGISFVSFRDFLLATLLAVSVGQGINVYFFHKAINIGKSPLDAIAAAVLKGLYFLIIILWQKKSKYISKE